MSKVFVAVQRLTLADFGVLYLHVGPDTAFTSNAKLTTHKRWLESELETQLINWSYNVNSPDALVNPLVPGSKVYTIQNKVDHPDGSLYLHIGPDTAYASKREAQRAIRQLREVYPDTSLCLYSFIVDPQQVPPEEVDYHDEEEEIYGSDLRF